MRVRAYGLLLIAAAVWTDAFAAAATAQIRLRPGPDGAVTVQKVAVEDCRIVRGFWGTPVDGSTHSRDYRGTVREYPRTASDGVAYSYNGNDGLHLTLADDGGFDAIVLRGGAAANVHIDADALVEPSDALPAAAFAGGPATQTIVAPTRQAGTVVSLFGVAEGVVADVSFYRVTRAAPSGGTAEMIAAEAHRAPSWSDLPLAPELDAGDILAARYAPDVGVDWLHRVGATPASADAVAAARLAVTIPEGAGETSFSVTVHDPLYPRQDVAHVEFTAPGAGAYDITVDCTDQVLLEGAVLWLAVGMPKGVGAEVDAAFVTTGRDEALGEALAWRKLLMRTYFSLLSEPRPWGAYRGQPREEFYATSRYAAQCPRLFAAIDQAYALAPDDGLVRQYREWVYLRALPCFSDIDDPAPPPEGVPAWAWYPRLAWLETRRIAEWWLDERLVETGEFGGRVGDDTDMYQQYVDLPYFESDGVAARLKAAAAALAELAQRENLRHGLNIHATDSLHAYEEGINHLALMARWFYGDPVYFERCMESARNMEALTILTEDGRRHFRTTARMGAEDVEAARAPEADGHANPLMWHTALQVADYNRNPRALALLQEWGDTWLRYQRPGEWATAVDVVSGEVVDAYESRPLYGGYSTQASVFTWLFGLTRDPKYVEPFLHYFRLGEAPHPAAGYLADVSALGGLDGLSDDAQAALSDRNAGLRLALQDDPAALVMRAIGKDRATTAQITSLRDAARWPDMYTDSHQFTDRIFPDIQGHASQAYLGGYMRRNRMHPTLAVSWEGFGTDYAAVVRENARDRLRVSVYSFADATMSGSMSLWALDHGHYHVTASVEGRAPTTRDVTLAKGSRLRVALAPRSVTTVEITQVRRLDDIHTRPDLAVAAREFTVADDSLMVPVHNIGSSGASRVRVVLRDGGAVVSEAIVPHLDAPTDLRPRVAVVHLPLKGRAAAGLTVVVDPGGDFPEIYEGNNAAVVAP